MKIIRMIYGKVLDFELSDNECEEAYEEQLLHLTAETAKDKTNQYIQENALEDVNLDEIDFEDMAQDFIENADDYRAPNERWQELIASYL